MKVPREAWGNFEKDSQEGFLDEMKYIVPWREAMTALRRSDFGRGVL